MSFINQEKGSRIEQTTSEIDPLAERFEFKNGKLLLGPENIPGLPAKLAIERIGDGFVLNMEALKNRRGRVEIFGLSFHGIKEVYYCGNHQEIIEGLRQADSWGRELLEKGEVHTNEGQPCLIIKKKMPGGELGPDLLRLNLYRQGHAENVIIDRVLNRNPSSILDDGVLLEPLLRWGHRSLLLRTETDFAGVEPGANVLRLGGCMPDRRQNGVSLPMPYRQIRNFAMSFLCNHECEDSVGLRVIGIKGVGTGSKMFPGLGVVLNGEESSGGGFEMQKDELDTDGKLPFDLTDLNREDLRKGLVVVKREEQDLAAFFLARVDGQLRMYYVRGTDHGQPVADYTGGIFYSSIRNLLVETQSSRQNQEEFTNSSLVGDKGQEFDLPTMINNMQRAQRLLGVGSNKSSRDGQTLIIQPKTDIFSV